MASHFKVKVEWFDRWHPIVDSALRELPRRLNCPPDLYRLLMETPSRGRKRIALITRNGIPIAVAGLRQRERTLWEPISQWLLPGMVIPAQSEELVSALEALGVDVAIAWWCMDAPPPSSRLMQGLSSTLVHRLYCSSDYEQHWRETNYLRTVLKARRLCNDFEVVVNAPGAVEWLVNHWTAKWRRAACREEDTRERIVAARYLESRGLQYTWSLVDRGLPVGGLTMTVCKRHLVAQVSYRCPAYDPYCVGIRLLDSAFGFARERGFECVDLGGTQAYKQRLAPQNGVRWDFRISPARLHQSRRILGWLTGAGHRLRHWTRADVCH